ncbi:hypothetical protein J4Q44_G00261010 [Coregonus suidteri]|uniref:Endonuclease/exonuclease/phosphatase domain-containing protein n=1 Tax=Coregonus suidteri TaxID=861788 RepID=A0AAN8L2J1_9TELE
MAGICEWEVWEESTVGSDHYPILCTVGRREEEVLVDGVGRWVFGRAKWDQFQELSEQVMARVDMRGDVDSMNNWVRTALVGAATEAIPKSSGRRRRKAVPWWMEECGAMPNHLLTDIDVWEFRESVKLLREIFAQKAFDPFRGPEVQPGPEF